MNHSNELADIHFVRQGDPKGLGHAVLRGRKHVGNEPFAVLLGDDLIDERDALLTTMIEQCETRGATVIALMEVDPSQIHLYGCAAVEPTDDPEVVKVTGLVEKPSARMPRRTSPSSDATCCAPRSSTYSRHTEPGKGGEIQLTDALQVLAADDSIAGGVYGVVFGGRRYDTGDRLDYIKSIVQLALDRDDLGPELRPWIKELAADLE